MFPVLLTGPKCRRGGDHTAATSRPIVARNDTTIKWKCRSGWSIRSRTYCAGGSFEFHAETAAIPAAKLRSVSCPGSSSRLSAPVARHSQNCGEWHAWDREDGAPKEQTRQPAPIALYARDFSERISNRQTHELVLRAGDNNPQKTPI